MTSRVNRMLEEQRESRVEEDRESRNGTFEVMAEHPAFSHTCCPTWRRSSTRLPVSALS